jgi:hypothetical protein
VAEQPDLGFSEFVAKLISETFTAVAEAAMEQERRYGQLVAAAELSLEEFVDAFVAPEDVDDALLGLFPAPGEGAPEGSDATRTSVAAGQPYQAAADDVAEHPPLRQVLGLEVEKGEITRAGRIGGTLAQRIRDEVALLVGRPEWEIAGAVVRRGVPRVLVDAGHIMAKQTYRVVAAAGEESPAAAPPATQPVAEPRFPGRSVVLPQLAGRTGVLGRVLTPSIRPDLLIRVTTPRDDAPVASSDIYGEVQVTFKTVP